MPGAKRVRVPRTSRGGQPKKAKEEEEASDIGEVLERWRDSAVVEDAGKLPDSPTVGVRVPTKSDPKGPATTAVPPAIPSSPVAGTEEEPTVAASKEKKTRKQKLLGSFKARISAWREETIAKKIERYQGRRERAVQLKEETLAAIEQQRGEDAKQAKKRARKGIKAKARKLLAELSHEAATKCARIDEKLEELDGELAALAELAAKLGRK
ncbi:hypothetical protein ABW21_db0207402 [Orbilia brochopaga]|nr:hypothetical protein ABW21_db0207402 [Drechslerella brochopaga]